MKRFGNYLLHSSWALALIGPLLVLIGLAGVRTGLLNYGGTINNDLIAGSIVLSLGCFMLFRALILYVTHKRTARDSGM